MQNLFSYPKYRPELTAAPFLPMSRAEMDKLHWDSCDIVLVTGDAYIDHPSFGMAIIGRTLEAQGFRVGIIAQPDWQSTAAFMALGPPNLCFGITAGNMDSMINHYTADRRIRSDDAYTPGGQSGKRPDRSVLVYANRCREAYAHVPLVLGGIEASLRRVAHYDYWSEKVRRSVLLDSRGDLLVYGNGERQIAEIAYQLGQGQAIAELHDIRGTALVRRHSLEGWDACDCSQAGHYPPAPILKPNDPYAAKRLYVRLPAYEAVAHDPVLYAHAARIVYLESNPNHARPLVQRHGDKDVWINPPALPLSTPELDAIYELPFSRRPHPAYGKIQIPAFDMIKFSLPIMRGCFGGCTFCSITAHEGRIIQSRSAESVVREIAAIRDKTPGFAGNLSDLGGPTANMYRMGCQDPKIQAICRRLSCIYPTICKNLEHSHDPLIELYRQARKVSGVKRIFIGSGIRYDLAVTSPQYIQELTAHHVSGQLKIAPEHTEDGPLRMMMKPGVEALEKFAALFEKFSRQAGKQQYLLPYFMAAHPGTTDLDMLELALWMKRHDIQVDQVQNFTPTPMSLATAMFHSGKNPLQTVTDDSPEVFVPKGGRERRLQKALLRYHDPENRTIIKEALWRMGRKHLIGKGSDCLIP